MRGSTLRLLSLSTLISLGACGGNDGVGGSTSESGDSSDAGTGTDSATETSTADGGDGDSADTGDGDSGDGDSGDGDSGTTGDGDGDGYCGDGIVNGTEDCDDGGESATCDIDCTVPECNDGIVNGSAGEECEDGNTMDGDGCDSMCQSEGMSMPVCGNGIIEVGEQCDDGNMVNTDDCLVGCVAASCGDGFIQMGVEICDDGNQVNTDGCPDGPGGSCVQAACGDGFVQVGVEGCDDGNTMSNDGCDQTCQVEGSCGDGTLDVGEECDLGSGNDDNASGDCPNTCRTTCMCPSCGDGVTDFAAGEQCDDGGNMPGDGCSPSCMVEVSPACGDGNLDIANAEECDDGNTNDGDGCSANCQYEIVGQSCGDGNVDSLEKCDDSNTNNGDGCNPTCNLTTTVTTLATGINANSIAVDDTYIWLTSANPNCTLGRIDIDDCINNSNCTPTVVAGGACGTPSDANGTAAVFGAPGSLTTDGSTVWLGDTHTIRAFDIASGDVTTISGQGNTNSCAAVDGVGSNAYYHDIRALTWYQGQIYLLDGCEQVLRRLDPNTGSVVTIAGTRTPDTGVTQSPPYTCTAGFNCVSNPPVDGYGTQANFGSPRYMAADGAGNLYSTDTNGEGIRSYNLATGWVGTFVQGTGYQDGTGSSVLLDRPRGMTSDGTSIYWAEQNAYTVRQLIISNNETSTMAGVRGCNGTTDGVGGDGSQDWSGNCGAAPNGYATMETVFGPIAFHYPTQSIFTIDTSDRLRRIE